MPHQAGEEAEPSTGSGIRTALHAAEIGIDGGEYPGIALDHVLRVLLAARPGQILCSEATAALLRGSVEPGKPGPQLADLGPHRLYDAATGVTLPERLFQVLPADLPGRD